MKSRTLRIVVIGAGAGGLCMGAKLREAGHQDFVILESAEGVGGTWRHNTYPGAACDIASHLYSFSFAPYPDWSRTFARQPEILAYLERVATEHGLEPHLRLGVKVDGARWDGEGAEWRIDTDKGVFLADVMISAVGMFGNPHSPNIPGLDTFLGKVLHSARWDHEQDLAGKSVAVLGNGASAIQLVPAIAPATKRFYHFQRQPQWVGPKKDDGLYADEQIEAFRRDPAARVNLRDFILDRVDGAVTYSNPEALKAAEVAGLQNLAVVEDAETRAKLMPVGPYGCHRPLNSEVYYPTFNLAHVDVVNDAVREVTPTAIVTADGVERPVDVIVFCTGFQTTKFLTVIDVIGRDGLKLEDAWAEGPQAYLGVATAGFPNLFMIYGPNTNNGSILYMIEEQAAHIIQQLNRMVTEDLKTLEVRADAMLEYNERVQQDIQRIGVWQGDCQGYYRIASGRNVTQWPHGMREYTTWRTNAAPDAYDGV